ncbi:DNRLRE domain-containing protein [Nocardioides sp. SYSU D00065]|uniref:CBM96 family carbohydrate-binding protein n=1 Tax=Nocardioides sp. SYSU D00065 TaxID=2817378 RepID=UPI001B33040F|nr:DNRLRE domain-containing protein [Nocardioides sp. SYSU D00065]
MKKLTPVLALAIGATGLALTPAGAAASDLAPVADSHVDARSASANFGDSRVLEVDGTAGRRKHAFLEFTVPALASGERLDAVELRLHPLTASPRGITVHRSGTGWDEDALTWRSMPTERTLLGTSDALRAGTAEVVALDAQRITPGRTLALRVETSARKTLTFGSREARAATRPVLSVTVADAPDTTPVPTPVPTTPVPTTPVPTTPVPTPPVPTPAPGSEAFPPAAPVAPKVIGMSAPDSLWDARLREVGAEGVTARRVFAELTASGSSQLPLIRRAIADGMMPVISYKVADPAAMANGAYDSWLATLREQLVALDAPVTATFWHEPHGDMDPAVFRAASHRFVDVVDAPDIAVGPILNGWLLDRRVADLASYTDADLLRKWDFVAVDSYQSGTAADPGALLPARAIPLLARWMDSVGHPDKPLGLGEYNGFTAQAIAQAGETLLSTPEVWFGLAWNSEASGYAPLTGDRITAFRETKVDARVRR